MKSSFMFYLLGIADVIILFYNPGQTFKCLPCKLLGNVFALLIQKTIITLFLLLNLALLFLISFHLQYINLSICFGSDCR